MTHGLIEYLANPRYLPAFSSEAAGLVEVPKTSEGFKAWRLRLPAEVEAKLSMSLGAVLVGVAVLIAGLWGGPILAVEVRQMAKSLWLKTLPTEEQVEVQKVARVTLADYIDWEPIPKDLKPVDSEFGLVIPKIEVNAKVVPQVNTEETEVYMAALKQGLVQAAGSALPGEKGDIFIFGHSTDFAWNITSWNALFYSLKEMEEGDKVYVFYEGEARGYRVTGKEVYGADEVGFLDPNGDRERLVLQTCWPPGTTLKRLVVLAEPVKTLAVNSL